MVDTNGSYFFRFLLFILVLPHLFLSCFLPYASLLLIPGCSLFYLSLLHPASHSYNLPPTIPCYMSFFSLFVSAAGQLSQSAHLALQLPYTVLGLGRSANFLDHLFVGIPRPPGGKVQTYLLTHAHRHLPYGGRWEESWVERPRERMSMQMAWFTSTCSRPVSETGNIVSDTLDQPRLIRKTCLKPNYIYNSLQFLVEMNSRGRKTPANFIVNHSIYDFMKDY